MIKKWSYLVLFFVLQPGLSYGETNEKQGLIQRIIDVSGMEQMLASIPEQIGAQIERRKLVSKTPEMEDAVGKILTDNFDSSKAKQDLVAFIDRNTKQEELAAILAWIDSPLGKRLSQAELDASKIESRASLLRYVADLQQTPPQQERIDLMQAFVESSRQIESSINAVELMMRGLASSMTAYSPKADEYSEEKINKQVADMRPIMQQILWEQLILTGLYTYQGFTNEEMQRYIDFLNSDVGRRYVDVNVLGIASIFSEYLKRTEPIFKEKREKIRAVN